MCLHIHRRTVGVVTHVDVLQVRASVWGCAVMEKRGRTDTRMAIRANIVIKVTKTNKRFTVGQGITSCSRRTREQRRRHAPEHAARSSSDTGPNYMAPMAA